MSGKKVIRYRTKFVWKKVTVQLNHQRVNKFDVSLSCVCPVFDHEFRNNIVKLRSCGSTRRQPSGFADYFDNVVTKLIVNNRTDAWKTDVNLFFFTIANCEIACSRSLTHRINYKFMCMCAYWQWKLANEGARISAVIVKRPVYSCLRSDLAFEWQRGSGWPCFKTNLSAFVE